MILADENIDARLVSALRFNNINVTSIKEDHPGVKDEEVIRLSKNPQSIILTEDKDFGEWVYSHNEKEISVILLRYNSIDLERIIPILLNLIITKGEGLYGKFTTITINKIRIRSL
jgi:predicted nuclease of predicted toxin-antitoxin system